MASIINASTSGAGGLIQTADSSGILALQAAGTTIASVSSTGVAVTGTVADSTGTLRPLVSGTAVASTSGTSIDFTGIPSWVKRITVMLSGVSTSGISPIQIQLGDSGGIENTGYLGSITSSQTGTATANFTTGFQIDNSGAAAAASIRHGAFSIFSFGANTWVINGSYGLSNTNFVLIIGGSKTLSDVLTQVRITTVNGTDTFDAGSINIMYE